MKSEIADVKNIRMMKEASAALLQRGRGVPGLGLVWGKTGHGKSTAAGWLANETEAIFVRALATWTARSMLDDIARELNGSPKGSTAKATKWVIDQVAASGRPLFIDEGDYLLGRKQMLETLRDVHDLSGVPIILIGMHDFRRRIVHLEQLAGRISQWVEFGPASVEDVRVLADTVCEVDVADDLLETLQAQTGGSMRGLTVALSRLEAMAKRRGLSKVKAADWGDKPFILQSEKKVA